MKERNSKVGSLYKVRKAEVNNSKNLQLCPESFKAMTTSE